MKGHVSCSDLLSLYKLFTFMVPPNLGNVNVLRTRKEREVECEEQVTRKTNDIKTETRGTTDND